MAEGRGGVVKKFLDHTTPSARANVASRLSLCRASTPPPAEEGSLGHSPPFLLTSHRRVLTLLLASHIRTMADKSDILQGTLEASSSP